MNLEQMGMLRIVLAVDVKIDEREVSGRTCSSWRTKDLVLVKRRCTLAFAKDEMQKFRSLNEGLLHQKQATLVVSFQPDIFNL